MYKQIKTLKAAPLDVTPQHRTLYGNNIKYHFNLSAEEILKLEALALDYGLSAKKIKTIMQRYEGNKSEDIYELLTYAIVTAGKDNL